jgi:hypothetical protein
MRVLHVEKTFTNLYVNYIIDNIQCQINNVMEVSDAEI